MEAMEKAIDDLTQKSENPERVIKLKRNSEWSILIITKFRISGRTLPAGDEHAKT
jgi:hypothetical protein